MNLGRRNKVKAEGGMSSMTDLVFLLLIFFIILSTKVEHNVPVDLPQNSDLSPAQTNPPVVLGVSENSTYFFEDDLSASYSFEEMMPILEQKMGEHPEKTLKISADKVANYEAVFQVIALAKQREWKPALAYKP
ncbi:MAG: biopolymer transporter ExbD [Crocinitomicaceae bacterium]